MGRGAEGRGQRGRKAEDLAFRAKRGISRAAFLEPAVGEILPPRVGSQDQSDLLSARPACDLLLSSNCGASVFGQLEIHQPCDVVPAGKPRNLPRPMLSDSSDQVTGNPSVERPAVAGENIDVECLHGRLRAGGQEYPRGPSMAHQRTLRFLGRHASSVMTGFAPPSTPHGVSARLLTSSITRAKNASTGITSCFFPAPRTRTARLSASTSRCPMTAM